ncbi:hypothetical protein DYB37_011564 [Aphanomyces astaci]|uniref:Uncharacterized protein n=1 Tax=Aphanomyces astaci TaxID=112090 RepID=A0A3R7BIF2_APHAT|nr:hypothetical protein DYB37_011564 [Aphanomyces astaci]
MSLRIIPKDQRTPVRRTSAARGKRYSNTSVSKRKSIKTWRGTVLPGLIMFLCTLGLIFLSIFLLFLLISQVRSIHFSPNYIIALQGMFKRQVVTVNAQLADTYFWAPYGQSCILKSDGFTPNSYDFSALYITPLFVLTVFLYYDYFPECLPTEPQDVAGMAMLETTIRDTHVDGLYFLTLYADLDPSMTVYSYMNSDGTTQNLIDNIKRTLITVDGQVETDKLGRDYIITSRPLDEVIVLQAMSSFLSLWFFAGDMFITIEGFYVNNATWPSGSYVAEGTPPIVTYLVKTIVTTVGGSFGIAIAISSIYRRIIHKKWLVSTVWCRSNSVLSALHLPNCITALPLESSNGIKMGNKMYCKPRYTNHTFFSKAEVVVLDVKYHSHHGVHDRRRASVRMIQNFEGSFLSTIVFTLSHCRKWGMDKRHANQLPNQLISIYGLVPAMVVPSWVSSLGTVDHNQFTPTPATRLAQAKPVVHTRGSCVV